MSSQTPLTTRQANRLLNETSTYLLQHAHNPVDWYPWGEEALRRAANEDKPILLSIGYAACHWCHVMEHESFEDETTAAFMNENFVCIKVDREERPDLDEIYMRAVQILTGHGGSPMTVFLTPNMKPFFGGTYYPPEERHGMPSFRHLLKAIKEAWVSKRQEIETSATEISNHLKLLDTLPKSPYLDQKQIAVVDQDKKVYEEKTLSRLEKMLAVFDHTYGGFGTAPKFPHTMTISLAMRCASKLCSEKPALKESITQMVTTTLEGMARGGIHDQIGGGFARYSTDRKWLVPHFEKMLYDNALLCQNYVEGFFFTGKTYFADVAENILRFALRELKSPESGFYSSLDADSEGQEGKYYVWLASELENILGHDDAQWLAKVYGVTKAGNFENGTNILHLTVSFDELCSQLAVEPSEFAFKLKTFSTTLLNERMKRVPPGKDLKILTSWNSLLISAMVQGFKATGSEEFLSTAMETATFIQSKLLTQDLRLFRSWGQSKANLNGYLDDYAYYIQALLEVASVDGDPRWLSLPARLMEVVLDKFSSEDKVGFYYTSKDHEQLLARTQNHFDTSTPSATAVTAFNLLKLGRLLDKREYVDRAEQLLLRYEPSFDAAPDQFAHFMEAQDFAIAKPLEVILVRNGRIKESDDLLFELHRHYLPNKVVIIKDMLLDHQKPPGYSQPTILKGKQLVNGQPAVYICENRVCDEPITSVNRLKEKMKSLI